MVDGASPWQTFTRVLLPLVQPILVVVGLLTFISTYSEYVLAKVLLTDKQMYTLAVGLNAMVANQFAQSWGVFSAGGAAGLSAHAGVVPLLPTLPGRRSGRRLGQGLGGLPAQRRVHTRQGPGLNQRFGPCRSG